MREKIDFNSGWKFRIGDQELTPPPYKDVIYLGAKTERELRGFASVNYGKNREYEYDGWRNITLPHDFIIEQEPKKQFNNTLGYFDYKNAWYRKSFKVDETFKGKRITIYFEGIATHATVYLNGCLMAHNFCGFTSFEVDISDLVRFDRENVIAVYVNTTDQHEGWWYSGGGIYRKVWLNVTDRVSVDLWGVYVHPEMKGDHWSVPVNVTLRNDDPIIHNVRVSADILYKGEIVASTERVNASVEDFAKSTVSLKTEITNPKLWSCESPELYDAVVHVFESDVEIDTSKTFFGFRTLRFDSDEGFFLNGSHTMIKGVCCHEDYGLEGKAISDSVKLLRLERLREMGANAYRTSHYPQSEKTFEYLAKLGFLIMAETRWFESTKEGLEQLEMLIKCHRNNPAVIMWSLGNEEPLHNTELGKRIFLTMRGHAKKLDNTRPFTTAVSNNPADAPVMDEVDIIGVNYNLRDYDSLHEKFPKKMIFASECCAVGSTRGWTYPFDSKERGYLHCYDNRTGWFMSREVTWKFISERKWIAGGFQWAGIEHRGETEWPRLCSQSGALDLFLQKKDAFYENKAHWTNEPMVHMIPNWNLPDRISETVRVWVYTNCDEVELIQDGRIIGRAAVEKYGHAEFDVVYTPGKLEAIGYRKGEKACSDVVKTTGKGVRLKLELQNKHKLSKHDTAVFNCYLLDEEGNVVPDGSAMISFIGDENTKIVGTGSDICDHVPVPCNDRRMRCGIASVCVRLQGGDKLRLYAKANGLTPDSVLIDIE